MMLTTKDIFMAYKSIDEVQEYLAKEVFGRTNDAKKASGRALGTFIETITYYLLKTWNFQQLMSIETRLPEYGYPDLTHNVEFTLHKLHNLYKTSLNNDKSLTTLSLSKQLGLTQYHLFESASSKKIYDHQEHSQKNCSVIGCDKRHQYIANIDYNNNQCICSELDKQAFAMFECKRVGKEGDAKGPQTIEKAKQGAYVARTVSELQRVIGQNGTLHGLLNIDGEIVVDEYYNCIDRIINGDLRDKVQNFILTVGIVSNHGNWFTAETQNKELRVLNHSYDWLLFLSDEGLTSFIQTIFEFPACKEAFIRSYSLNEKTGRKNSNCFTKSIISVEADTELTQYFSKNIQDIESWFNILTPNYTTLSVLKNHLNKLGE